MNHNTLRTRLEQAADDIGRLRRGVPPGSSLCHAVDRISGQIEELLMMLDPSAAELVADRAPAGDGRLASEAVVVEALRIVDARSRTIRHRLGHPEAA